MPQIAPSSIQLLSNLKQLPKDKIILEYILAQLTENSSPEKAELISSLFDMYRTSTGFDPIAVSKGRFKRVKAADFKRMIAEIDFELGSILQTDEYLQLQAKQVNHSTLFNNYLTVSDEVNRHPASSMQQDVENFEKKLHLQDSQELLLSFYRHHRKYFEETYANTQLETLLQKYDRIQERTQQHSRQTRCGFILKWLEEEFLNGKCEHKRIQEVWDELAVLLTSETNKFTRHELLICVIRCGLLTATPARNLDQYMIYCSENLDHIIRYNADAAVLIYSALSLYHPDANAEKRLEWVQKAEHISREHGRDDIKGYFRLINALNASDELNHGLVIRYLNEAEHQVHRTQGRSLVARNTWIQVCEYRIMMYALLHMKNPEEYPSSEFDIHIRIAEDLGKHCHNNSILIQELRGYKNFIAKDWEQALECFEFALRYRAEEPENDRMYLDKYFKELLKNKTKKKEEVLKESMFKLKELNSPFFRSQAQQLCNDAATYFNENQKNKMEFAG